VQGLSHSVNFICENSFLEFQRKRDFVENGILMQTFIPCRTLVTVLKRDLLKMAFSSKPSFRAGPVEEA